MQIVNYTTDLTDAQWKLLQPMLPARKKRGRQPTDPRRVINAIVYILKGGIQWRLLPAGFPPWQTVYHIFRRWIADNTWQSIHDRLRAMVRNAAGKEVPHPRFHTRSASGTNLLRISPREGTGVCASSEKERKRKKLEPDIFLPIGLRSNGRPRSPRIVSLFLPLRDVHLPAKLLRKEFIDHRHVLRIGVRFRL